MKIQAATRPNRREYKNEWQRKNRPSRRVGVPQFIGVDSEGITDESGHRAVLLGIGSDQYTNSRGLYWEQVFSWFYSHFQANPKAAYVGFYLGYDFNQWLRSLPQEAAVSLLTDDGKEARKPKYLGNTKAIPVRCAGWEFDMMGFKRLSIRPGVCDCRNVDTIVKCPHEQKPWANLCDAGAFFQMSFMSVLDPANWTHNGQLNDWPCTEPIEGYAGDALYQLVLAGKERRSYAVLDEEMKLYNRIENVLLSRVMRSIATGFDGIGISLNKDQWYGPGAAAANWLGQKKAPKRSTLSKIVDEWFLDLCKGSYYGGWFEIFSSGLIPGVSYNYDINNAYPYAIKNLPCMAHEGKAGHQKNGHVRKRNGRYILVYARVNGASNRIGPLPFRKKNGNILRPRIVQGWYWLDELEASINAGLVESYQVKEWAWFEPCQCSKPFAEIQDLYDLRLRLGKNTSQGKAIKLTNNSGYGKFAQNVGSAPYGNWFYASRITASCRIQILDAIASSNHGASSVLMVATDGICFDEPHTGLPISKKLGEWDESEYTDLTLFKPGVYWHKEGREAVLKAKTRGVPKAGLIASIDTADAAFALWQKQAIYSPDLVTIEIDRGGFPRLEIPIPFRMTSCKQAIQFGRWNDAGTIDTEITSKQDSNPHEKRYGYKWNSEKSRLDTFVIPMTANIQTVPYGEHEWPAEPDMGYDFDGDISGSVSDMVNQLKEPDVTEWVTVWDSMGQSY
jgi:DNA polymerase type B, organellar and viral